MKNRLALKSPSLMISTCARKSKFHPKYSKIYGTNTVSVLRERARSSGTKKWYSLRKANLASAIIIHDSALTITNLFRGIVVEKRLRILEDFSRNGSECPITLTRVSELRPDDIFIHGGKVFSRESVLDYVKSTVDFLNPITREMMHLHDIERLGCQYALDKYRDREVLRKREVNTIRQFAFLETELENILISLIHQYYVKNSECFQHTLRAFRHTWKEMKAMDMNRTICVLKSLQQSADRFKGTPRIWGRALVDSYLQET